MIKLSKEYTTEIVYPLKYTNLEKKQLLITDAPKNLVLYITANGYRLLQLKYLRKLDSLQIDLTNIKLHKENNSYYGWIKTNDIIRLNKQLFPTKMVSVVKPDTLQFEFESVATKKVNINPNLNLDFANGYEQADSIIIEPKQVTIKGYAKDINEITSINTEYKKIKDIKSTQKLYIKLIANNSNNKIKLSPDSVKIIIPVKKRINN